MAVTALISRRGTCTYAPTDFEGIALLSLSLTLSPTAPGPVEGLTASFDTAGSTFNTTSRMYTLNISIMWDEPTNPNGVITSHNVTVYQTDDPNNIIFSDSAVTATTVTESVMALPYTNYTVAVTASTSAGEGEEESVIETSPQAGTPHFPFLSIPNLH